MSLAERCYRLARRHDKAVRYAIARAQHPVDEALRNYLLLVSRAHGLHPHMGNQSGSPLLEQLLHGALGGDPMALALFHDAHEDQTGYQPPSPQLLHQAPLHSASGTNSLLDLLAGLHHRSLGTEFHEHPLPVEQMFGGAGLVGVPGVAAYIRGRMLPRQRSIGEIVGRLRSLQDRVPEVAAQLDPIISAIGQHHADLTGSGRVLDLPPYIDAIHGARTIAHITGSQLVHGNLENLGDSATTTLHHALGGIEQHHGLGG